jgi:hypothetical protein
MSRPQTLAEAAVVALAGDKSFAHAVDEFIDAFYLDRRQDRLDAAPMTMGDALRDAWLGAVGEHLARRWDFRIPLWTDRPQHFRLSTPVFFPASVIREISKVAPAR